MAILFFGVCLVSLINFVGAIGYLLAENCVFLAVFALNSL